MKKILVALLLIVFVFMVFICNYCNYRSSHKWENKNIVFLGDSLTYGTGLEAYGYNRDADRWPHLVCEALGANEFNFGVEGSSISRNFPHKYDEAGAIGDLIIIYFGTNCYWCNIHAWGESVEAPFTYEQRVNMVIDYMLENYPDKQLLFITPHSQNPDDQKHNSNSPNNNGDTLNDFTDIVKKICGEKNIKVLDLNETVGFDVANSDADKKKYTFDGCHYTPEGHAAVAAVVEKYIRDNF